MSGEHADHAIRRWLEAIDGLAQEIGERAFRLPGRSYNLDALAHRERLAAAKHVNVTGTTLLERLRVIDGGGIERVVVTGNQYQGNCDGAHGFKRLRQHSSIELIGFEHVSAYDDELSPVFVSQRPDASNGLKPGLQVARARLFVEIVRGHAELPVACCDELHGPPPRRAVSIAWKPNNCL